MSSIWSWRLICGDSCANLKLTLLLLHLHSRSSYNCTSRGFPRPCSCHPDRLTINKARPMLSPPEPAPSPFHFYSLLIAPSCLRPSSSAGHQCSRCHTTQFPLEEFPPSSCERPSSQDSEGKARAVEVSSSGAVPFGDTRLHFNPEMELRRAGWWWVGYRELEGQHVVSAVYLWQDPVLTGAGIRQLVSPMLNVCLQKQFVHVDTFDNCLTCIYFHLALGLCSDAVLPIVTALFRDSNGIDLEKAIKAQQNSFLPFISVLTCQIVLHIRVNLLKHRKPEEKTWACVWLAGWSN